MRAHQTLLQNSTKLAAIFAALPLAFSLAACSAGESSPSDDYSKGYKDGLAAAATSSGVPEVGTTPVASDKHIGVVPNLVGQNVAQAATWSLNEDFRVMVGAGNLLVRIITPDGTLVTEENAANYKIVSQDPAAGTSFKMTYMLDEDGKEDDWLVDSQGIWEVVVNAEPID